MRKEVVFAILAGVVFGIILALGIWRANSALQDPILEEKEATQNTTPTPFLDFDLALSTPEDYDVLTTNPQAILGISSPNTWVALSNGNEDIITKTDESGKLSVEMEFIGGTNQLIVTALKDTFEPMTIKRIVVFSRQFGLQTDNGNSDDKIDVEDEATDEADPVREKVQKKLTEAQQNPKTFIGTITDITETSIQLNNIEGEIEQISLSDKTVYINSIDDNKSIEFSDVAIGDYIVSMGHIIESTVLDALRVLVSEKLVPTNRTARIGQVIENDEADFILRTANGNFTIEFEKNILVTSVQENEIIDANESDIESGDTVIVLGDLQGEILSTNRIQITAKADLPTDESENEVSEE